MPLEVARTLLAAAEVERRRRRRGAARSLLERARQICLDCKAKPLLERVEAELARLEPGRPGQELTPMEERITAMVVAGATNREIAEALAIGLTTVESSLSHIYRKLGLRSRVDLVRYRVSGP
jgi:DNA-binding CsgD family transcriptional regulator